MKKFETGDRVSFINEKQDGVIIKILPNGNCMVEIEDGFEIESTPGELVKVAFTQKNKDKSVEPIITVEKVKPAEVSELKKLLTGLNDSVSLVLMPSDVNKVLTGSVKYFIVNESKYDVLYSFSRKSDRKLFGISSGKVEAFNEINLGEIVRDHLMDTESLQVQLIFHQKDLFQQIPVVTKELSVEYPDLNHVNKKIPV